MNESAPTVARPLPARAGAILSEAVRGSHRDFTEGPIGPAIVILAIPMVMEMIMESIFAIADIFWVSKLGADAVATVGITESMLALKIGRAHLNSSHLVISYAVFCLTK